MKLERKEIIDIIGAVAVICAGVYAFGKFDGRLDQMEQRLGKLEDRVDPLRQLRVGKGDLCLKMLEQFRGVRDDKSRQELLRQWSSMDCESLPAGASMTEAEAQSLGYDAAGNKE